MKLSYYLLSNKYIIAEKEFYIILEISYLRRDILVDIKKIKSGEERESITEEHIKEGISKAYVKAIASFAGLNTQEYGYDYGLDGTFSGVTVRNRRIVDNGIKLDYQLKSSTRVTIEDDFIKYPLESKNYNDLVTKVATPRILIVYKLPENREEWIKISEESTSFKDCAWWYSLCGQDSTINKSSKIIKIPRNQGFNDRNLQELMRKVERGENL